MNAPFALSLLLLQSPAITPGRTSSGRPDLPDGAKLLLELKDERPDHFGMGMLALGDIDRDGVTDIYVGARSGVQGLSTGQGYGDVFSGRSGKLLYRIESEPEPEGHYFGCSVARVEDVDGDGIAEIAIHGEHLSTWQCYLEVRSGKDGRLMKHWPGLTFAFDAGDHDGDGRRELVLNGDRVSRLVSLGQEDERPMPGGGRASALTGDLDADGVRDFLDVPEWLDESCAVRSGRDGGVLASLADPEGWEERFRSRRSTGDANGDGFVDVLITCYEEKFQTRTYPASEPRFRLILVSGKDGSVLRDRWEELGRLGDIQGLIDLGDIDSDGCADLFVARSVRGDPRASARIYSGKDDSILAEITSAGGSFGMTAANVGDLDGDRVPDLVVGEHEYGKCEGRAWVISLGSAIRKK